MIKDLFEAADAMAEVIPKDQQTVIKTFKKQILKKHYDTARIISDELVDFFIVHDKEGSKLERAETLYNKTMEYYELNNF